MRRTPGVVGWLIVADPLLGDHRWPWWRWWRRRVHPWTDVPTGRTGSEAGGPAPIVAGVVFVSERESGSWIDCVPCSGTMVAGWAEREPSPDLNDAHRIREGAGLPHSGGMTDYQLAQGLEAVYGTSGTTIPATKSGVLAALDEGRALAWFHTYGRLPSDLRRWCPDFTGGHCAAIIGRKSPTSELVGWWDPLATEGWTGEWVDIDTLLAADWGDPARSYVRSAPSETGGLDMGIAWSLERWNLPAGTAIYEAPKGKKVGSFGDPVTRTTIGSALTTSDPDGINYGWRAIVVESSLITGNLGNKILWIERPAADPVATSAAWDVDVWGYLSNSPDPWPPIAPTPSPNTGDYQDGARDMWDTWAEGLGVPRRPDDAS